MTLSFPALMEVVLGVLGWESFLVGTIGVGAMR